MRASVALLVLSILIFSASLFFNKGPFAEAHSGNYGFKWFSTGWYDQEVNDQTVYSGWQSAVSSALLDWDWQTVLAPHKCYYGCWYEMTYYDGYFGDTGWWGIADVYCCAPNPLPCFSGGGTTGTCNMTNRPANLAYLYMNTYYNLTTFQQQYTAGHELGHVYGLNHDDCSGNDLMEFGFCGSPTVNTLKSHDLVHVDQIY